MVQVPVAMVQVLLAARALVLMDIGGVGHLYAQGYIYKYCIGLRFLFVIPYLFFFETKQNVASSRNACLCMLCIIVVQVPAGTVQVLGAGALQLMDLERVGHLYGRDQAILLQENEV